MAGYLRKRSLELATPATRAITDPLGDWSTRNIRLDQRPFSFEGHEYLRTIYDDTARHIVLSKAAQIGGTVWAILRSFHACLNGLSVIYYFPTRTDVQDFSRGRVGPLLQDNPFLSRRMSDTDTVGLKRIGDAHLYFRGMQSTVGMKSVPADAVVFDELDEVSPEARSIALERLAHSDYKRIIELSNPSLPGYGIDEQYEKSDQRHWHLKCDACGHRTCLEREFPTKLGREVRVILSRQDGTFFRACAKCSRELDMAHGEWIADFPDRPTRGYRISQLFSAKVDPGEILEEYRTTRHPDRFYQLKIGIPWADLDHRLDMGTVLALRGEVTVWDERRHECVMGVDTGKDLHVVIMRRDWTQKEAMAVIKLATVQSFQDLGYLMERYRISLCVIDGLPETHATRAFAAEYSGQVYLCFFNESARGALQWDFDNMKVLVNRTEALDLSRAIVRRGEVRFSQALPQIELFARHMAADAKQLQEDPDTGAKKYKYIRTGEDHYSLAFTYACMAASLPLPCVA